MHDCIKAYSIGEAWLLALKAVMIDGIEIQDDKGPILEIVPLFIEIIHPSLSDTIIEAYSDKAFLEFLSKNFSDLSPIEGWGYSYAQRLYSYNNIDQIQEVVNTLNKNPFSKSATISLLLYDEDKKHTPCLTTLDFKIRDDTLIITASFRSQDIGKKMYGDALELTKIGNKMIQSIPAKEIVLILAISSAHIYVDDIAMVQSIINTAKEAQ